MALFAPDGRDVRESRWDVPPDGFEEIRDATRPGGRIWFRKLGKHNFLSVLASVDGGWLHVSIAHNARYPTWDEILSVRSWGFPEETEVVMVLARKSEYVNLHQNCFHLWESACGREGR